jgi:hypothetical protein
MPMPRKQGRGWQALILGTALTATAAVAQQSGGMENPQAADLLSLEAHERQFRVTEGASAGKETTLALAPVADAPRAEWRLELEGFNELYLTQTGDGGIALTQIRIAEQNKRIVFDEPVTLLPAQLQAGETYSMQTTARIYDTQTGEQTRSGSVQHQVTPVGPTRFDLPQGQTQGYLVRMQQTVDLDKADIKLDLEAGFVPGAGMVHRRLEYAIEKLGLFGDTTSRTAVLAEPLEQQTARR